MDRCWLLSVLVVSLVSCTGRGDKRLLTNLSGDVVVPSGCILSCTSQTYSRMMESGDRRTVRFRPANAGEHGRYCWSTQMRLGLEEQLQEAYVVLPVRNDMWTSQGLRPSHPITQEILRPHWAPTAVSDDCGQRFDITRFYVTLIGTQSSFCVEAVPPLGVLKCPPFMVTTWLRQHPSPT